jgi:hypothetical protein
MNFNVIEKFKGNKERYVIGRRFITTIHQFERTPGNFLGPTLNNARANIDMTNTCSGFPVQYEGTVNDKKAYYRDRHNSWYFEIYENDFMGKVIYRKNGSSRGNIGFHGMMEAEKRIIKYSLEFAISNPTIESRYYKSDYEVEKNIIHCSY